MHFTRVAAALTALVAMGVIRVLQVAVNESAGGTVDPVVVTTLIGSVVAIIVSIAGALVAVRFEAGALASVERPVKYHPCFI